MSSRFSRRDFLRGAAISALSMGALAMAGCQPTEAPAGPQAPAAEDGEAAAPAGDVINLRWALNHGAIEMPQFEEVLENFHDANPNIRVEMFNIPDLYYEAINTQGVGGDLADVIYVRSYDTQPFAYKGWIIDLEPFIDAAGIDTDDFWPAHIAQMSFDGKLYCLPYDFSNLAIYYNADLFDEMEIPYPDGSWDWNDVSELAVRFVEKEGGRQTRWGLTIRTDVWTFPGLLYSHGGELFTEDNRCVIDSEENRQVVQMLVDMRKQGAFPEAGALPEGVDAFVTGMIAMECNGSWAPPGFRERIGDRFPFDVARYPKGSTGKSSVSTAGGSWSVTRDTKDRDAAFAWLNHLTSTESCIILISEPVRSVPGRKSAVDEWVKNAELQGDPANVKVLAEQMEDAFNLAYPPYWKDYEVIYFNRIVPLINGEYSEEPDIGEVLAQVQAEVQEVIDDFYAD